MQMTILPLYIRLLSIIQLLGLCMATWYSLYQSLVKLMKIGTSGAWLDSDRS